MASAASPRALPVRAAALARAAAGLGLAAAVTTLTLHPALADGHVGRGGVIDATGGSVKDYRNVVAVPAPRPLPSPTRDWYLRGDIGYEVYAHARIEERGGPMLYDLDQTSRTAFASIGMGRYLTPTLRMDLTFDVKPKRRIAPVGQRFTETTTDPLLIPAAVPPATRATYDVAHEEQAFTTNYAGMLNLYWTVAERGPVDLYLGAGLGGAIQRFERAYTQTATCATVDADGDPTTPETPCAAAVGPVSGGPTTTTSVGFAAALMAGFSVDVAPGVAIDTGYRLMWEGVNVAFGGTNALGTRHTIGLSDRFDHEIRTGLRFDLTP
jgi:opacity protein-like surface antigen